MTILFGSLSYQQLTGSELYLYELQRELTARGHAVFIHAQSTPTSELVVRTKARIVTDADLKQLTPDILHLQQLPVTQSLLDVFPGVPAIGTLHAWFLPAFEQPPPDPRITAYIATSEPLVPYAAMLGIDQRTVLIPNPIDTSRYHPRPIRHSGPQRVLCAGVGNQFRLPMARDLIRRGQEEGFCLWFLGREWQEGLRGETLPTGSCFLAPTWHTEQLLAECDAVAGLYPGRTMVEGWLCGKDAYAYDVASDGTISYRGLLPAPSDVGRFDSRVVYGQLLDLYAQVRGGGQ